MKSTIFLLLLILPGWLLHAQIGSTQEESMARYGKPERNEMRESGLLFFRKGNLCYIAHFYQGICDVMSIFSGQESMGFPEELSDDQITDLLKSDGGGSTWSPVPRFSINGVWNSSDKKSFAIYDTMRHKLVIMTRAAYKREKEATESLRSGH